MVNSQDIVYKLFVKVDSKSILRFNEFKTFNLRIK